MKYNTYQCHTYDNFSYKYLDEEGDLFFFYDSPFTKSLEHFLSGNGHFAEYRGIQFGIYWDTNLIFQL